MPLRVLGIAGIENQVKDWSPVAPHLRPKGWRPDAGVAGTNAPSPTDASAPPVEASEAVSPAPGE